jgi:hypothetical protein
VTFDQNFERLAILVLRGSDESYVPFVGEGIGRSDRSFFFADIVYEFRKHS